MIRHALDRQKCVETVVIVLWLMFMTHRAWKTSIIFTGCNHSLRDYKITASSSSVIYSSSARIWRAFSPRIKKSPQRSSEPDTPSIIKTSLHEITRRGIYKGNFMQTQLTHTNGAHDMLHGCGGHGLGIQKPTWAPRGKSTGNSGARPCMTCRRPAID